MCTLLLIDRCILIVNTGLSSQVKMGEEKQWRQQISVLSFYCIRCLTTIILIGKKFIYTNKLNLITRIFRLVRKQRISCFECLWKPKSKKCHLKWDNLEKYILTKHREQFGRGTIVSSMQMIGHWKVQIKVQITCYPYLLDLKWLSNNFFPLYKERLK